MATNISSEETKRLIRLFLMQDTGIASRVGERVFGAHLEDADAQTVLKEGPIIVFEFLSGFARYNRAVQTQTFEVYGYSKRNSAEATAIYDLVVDRLQAACVKVDSVDMTGLARESQRPVDGFVNVLGAWFVRGRWSISTT